MYGVIVISTIVRMHDVEKSNPHLSFSSAARMNEVAKANEDAIANEVAKANEVADANFGLRDLYGWVRHPERSRGISQTG